MVAYALSFEWPYSTRDLPGIGGRLRATPQDFVVEEVPLYLPVDSGQHLYVNLTKEELTTPEIQARLGRLFELRRGDVGFAGLKDKFARTTQTFSLNVGHVDPSQQADFAAESAARIADAIPVTVHWARFHQNKLKPGHLLGNRFTINVHELACTPEEAESRARAIVQDLEGRGVPNYFGPQRFGNQGTNVVQGLDLLAGKRTKRDRWLRKFLISSVQSYLCNIYLAQRLERGLFDRLLTGDIAKKYATGGIFLVEDWTVEQPRYAAQEISFMAPIFGAKMRAVQGESAEFEQGIVESYVEVVEGLAKARTDGTRRLGRLIPHDLQVTALPATGEAKGGESTGGLQLSFFLPKGAFATTILREFLKTDVTDLAAIDADTDE